MEVEENFKYWVCNKQISVNGVRKPVSFDVTVPLFTSHSGPCSTPDLPKSTGSTECGLMEVTGLLQHFSISVCPASNEVDVCPDYISVYRILFLLITDYLHLGAMTLCTPTPVWPSNSAFEATLGEDFFFFAICHTSSVILVYLESLKSPWNRCQSAIYSHEITYFL